MPSPRGKICKHTAAPGEKDHDSGLLRKLDVLTMGQ
jgi:hypothetical protein